MSVRHYSPLRYPGGKNRIFPFVSNLFYENELIGVNYAEPYAGGAGLSLRLLFEEYANDIYINDLDRAIYAFWQTILDQTEEFCKWIEKVEINIDNWMLYKKIQKQDNIELFELAKSTFFLNRTNISGIIKGGPIGGILQNGKYKIDARFNKADLIYKIRKIAQLKHRIFVSNYDGIEFIKSMNRKKSNIFIYLDPPYVQKGYCLYMNFFSMADHEKLSKHIHKLKKRWMLSYDNNNLINDLYQGDDKVVYKLSQCASNRIGDEILIFSKDIKYTESIENLQVVNQTISSKI